MIMSSVRSAAVGALALAMIGVGVLHGAPASLTVEVDKPGVKISPTLWGIFFEDINLSADGGIYPEFVRNRSFEDSDQPDHWTITKAGNDKSEVAIDTSRPLDPMNRQSLRVKLDGSVTLINKGYWGMNVVKGGVYQVRLAARAADGFKGPIGVSLRRADATRVEGVPPSNRGQDARESGMGFQPMNHRQDADATRSRGQDARDTQDGSVLAQGEITGLTDQWKGFSLDLKATDTDSKAQLSLAIAGKGRVWLDMVCVAPAKTWKKPWTAARLVRDARRSEAGVRALPGRLLGRGRRHGAHVPLEEHDRRRSGIASRYGTSGGTGPRTAWAITSTCRLCEDLGAEPLFVHQRRHVAPRGRPDGPDGPVGPGRAGRDRVRQRPGRLDVGRLCGRRTAIPSRST